MKRGGGLGEESERQSRRLLLHPAAAETFASYNLHAIMMMMIIMPYTIRNPSLHPMLQLYNWIISIPVRELFRAIIPPHLSISTMSDQGIATAHYPQPSLIATSIWFDFHSALALYSSIISFVSFFS
jgi:hypothetical protein